MDKTSFIYETEDVIFVVKNRYTNEKRVIDTKIILDDPEKARELFAGIDKDDVIRVDTKHFIRNVKDINFRNLHHKLETVSDEKTTMLFMDCVVTNAEYYNNLYSYILTLLEEYDGEWFGFKSFVKDIDEIGDDYYVEEDVKEMVARMRKDNVIFEAMVDSETKYLISPN